MILYSICIAFLQKIELFKIKAGLLIMYKVCNQRASEQKGKQKDTGELAPKAYMITSIQSSAKSSPSLKIHDEFYLLE